MLVELWLSSTFLTAGLSAYAIVLKKILSTPPQLGDLHPELEVIRDHEEAIRLTTTEKNWSAPLYINAGSMAGVGIPFGGGTRDEEKILVSMTKRKNADAVSGYNMDVFNKAAKNWYLNSPDDLRNFCNSKGLDMTSFPANFPIRAYVYGYPKENKPPLFYHSRTGLLSYNQKLLARTATLERTFHTMPGIALVTFCAVTSVMVSFDWPSQKYRLKNIFSST